MQANEPQIGLHAKHTEAEIGLISAHVSGQLNGLVAQIKVRQVYKNWSDDNIECVYTFPLGWQSVLLGMRVELNGKSMTGMVKPKKVAEAQYEQAIDSGDLPVMLERSGKDLYTANIGNIQTGDEVVIEFDYAQILKAEDGTVRFSLPTTIAPRYGDASAAGLKPHQHSESDPQAEQRLFLSLELSESLSSGTLHSPTHEIQHNRQDQKCSIKLDGAAWLDRDFVLVIDRLGDMHFALAAQDPMRPGEATVLTGNVYAPQKPQYNRPAVIKVLVDCSGSMQGDSIEQAKACLNWLVGQLNNTDLVSFSRFGNTVHHDHATLKPCNLVYRQFLKKSARQLNADLGGTEIEQALKEVIAIDGATTEEAQNAVILLITDGEVWNIEPTIAEVRDSGHRIFAVGVGSAPAESLLKDMAEVTGGAYEMVTPRESMQRAVERMLHRIRQSHAIEQDIACHAPITWQSKTTGHAAPGESLLVWTQIKTDGIDLQALNMVQTHHPDGKPTPCPVKWDNSLNLSRIAAALRLRDMRLAGEREAVALEYHLVTSETNLILVHERAAGEKAEDLPELLQVKPMLAAGWAGNGSVQPTRRMPSLMAMRTGCDNVSLSTESLNDNYSVAAVWRSSRTLSSRTDGMANGGMDGIEIPAFLRRESSTSGSIPLQQIVQHVKDFVSPSPKSTQRQDSAIVPLTRTAISQTPTNTPDELIAVLKDTSSKNNPVQKFLWSFNQAALSHKHFRSALAACLRTNQAGYLQWLVTKHMKSAGSAAPIWALFIQWAAAHFAVQLDRHAERILRDFLASVNAEFGAQIHSELDTLAQTKCAMTAPKKQSVT